MAMKMGRKTKWFTTQDGKAIDGLVRRTDGRYCVKATGQTFRAATEAEALQRFRKLTEGNERITLGGKPALTSSPWSVISRAAAVLGKVTAVEVDSPEFWQYVAEQLYKRPFYVAERTGCPQLGNWSDMPIPGKTLALEDLCERYCQNSGCVKETAAHTRKVVKDFRKLTGVETLRDMTTEKLLIFREAVKAKTSNPHTLSGIFGKLKVVVGFGLKEGLDAAAITAALARMKVLYVAGGKGETDPNPIDAEVFRKLVEGASPELRAVLLLSLNACLYLSECLAVQWAEVSLVKGTYQTDRNKTGVPRAATLWPETIAALKALPHKGESPYVFTSSHGTRYNVNSYRDKFAVLRKAVGVASEIEFNMIRDGAYTAACEEGVDFAFCQMLSGHKLPGQSDAYVKRTAQKVRPACEAVYKTYAPFPQSRYAVRIGRPRKLPEVVEAEAA